MEEYIYENRRFIIEIRNVGKRFDWCFYDGSMRRHNNMDELAPTEQIAVDEAKLAIHRFVERDG